MKAMECFIQITFNFMIYSNFTVMSVKVLAIEGNKCFVLFGLKLLLPAICLFLGEFV